MKKGQKKDQVKKMIPKSQLTKSEKIDQEKKRIIHERSEESKERIKKIYQGVLDGIDNSFSEMEKEKMGSPTFSEITESLSRVLYDYNHRALEQQWENVQFVEEKK